MLEEFEKSVKATLYDRLSSPLIGSFITAWSIINYKFFLVIFSKLSYPEKIDALEEVFYSSNVLTEIARCFGRQISPCVTVYCNTFILPAICAVLYIWAYPWFAKKVFRAWQQYIKDKRDIKNEIQKTQLLTIEESEKIREQFLRRQIEINSLVATKDAEIEELKEKCRILEADLAELRPQTPPQISDGALDILSKVVAENVAEFHVTRTRSRIVLAVGTRSYDLDGMAITYLEELVDNNFVKRGSTSGHYFLLAEGKKYAEKNNFNGDVATR